MSELTLSKPTSSSLQNSVGLFGNTYFGKKVLVTGHTGFKGSWLSFWLNRLGAKVWGYSLNPQSKPNHWDILKNSFNDSILEKDGDIRGDIRNLPHLQKVFSEVKPDIVFHLAAQALVLPAYEDPIETYSSNLMGTLNIYEVARKSDSCKAIVSITSDKVYQNDELNKAFTEKDTLGGYDPYSSSKACVEIMSTSYRNSFLNIEQYKLKHNILLATARAGNVIGGGDWAAQRLIPDIIRATTNSEKVSLRSPSSTRPWQHVLDPISGYLQLGQKLLSEQSEYSGSWNFGPKEYNWSVLDVIKLLKLGWPKIEYSTEVNPKLFHEAKTLSLNCEKAHSLLGWKPIWNTKYSIEKTIAWYSDFYSEKKVNTEKDLQQFILDAQEQRVEWAVT